MKLYKDNFQEVIAIIILLGLSVAAIRWSKYLVDKFLWLPVILLLGLLILFITIRLFYINKLDNKRTPYFVWIAGFCMGWCIMGINISNGGCTSYVKSIFINGKIEQDKIEVDNYSHEDDVVESIHEEDRYKFILNDDRDYYMQTILENSVISLCIGTPLLFMLITFNDIPNLKKTKQNGFYKPIR